MPDRSIFANSKDADLNSPSLEYGRWQRMAQSSVAFIFDVCHIEPMPPPPPRILHEPQPGCYRTRFVEGGPQVPVLIELVADANDPDGWKMQATVDGKRLGYAYTKAEVEAECLIWVAGGRSKDEWTPSERLVMNILLARPIDQAEYERLLDLRRRAPPWHPCHRPYEKIDLSKYPPVGRRSL